MACREHSAKRALIRIVRTAAGEVEIDPTGRMNGRGAYLCDQPACWSKALANSILAKALNVEISRPVREGLTAYAASLTASIGTHDRIGEE